MRELMMRLVADWRGVTAIEYALIAGFIAIVVVAIIGGIGSTISSMFTSVSTSL